MSLWYDRMLLGVGAAMLLAGAVALRRRGEPALAAVQAAVAVYFLWVGVVRG